MIVAIILILIAWLVAMPLWLSVVITVMSGVKLYMHATKLVMALFKGASEEGDSNESD